MLHIVHPFQNINILNDHVYLLLNLVEDPTEIQLLAPSLEGVPREFSPRISAVAPSLSGNAL